MYFYFYYTKITSFLNFDKTNFRCLEALGEWGQLHEVFEEKMSILSEENKQKGCRLGLASALGLHNYQSMER